MRSMRTLAVVIVALALAPAVAGCDKKSDDPKASAAAAAASASAVGARAVAVNVDDKGFTPNSVDVKKGEKIQLVFTRTSEGTCATEVVFPDLHVTKALPLGKAVAIDVPTDAARTLAFQCGMGMYKSKLVIN